MSDSEQGEGYGGVPPEAGREREMVAPLRTRYDNIDAKKGPVYSGAKKDWQTFEFLMTGFLERYDLVDTKKTTRSLNCSC